MEKATLGGVALAALGIGGGLLLEGGNLNQVTQPTAAMIVLGGTLGATLVQFPVSTVISAMRAWKSMLFGSHPEPDNVIDEIVAFANQARREGIVSLDARLGEISDPFLKKALTLAVDGTEPKELRSIMELQLENECERDEDIPKVFESAGGYCPTIGIIGAVIGLIQVMQNLSNIEMVGSGIAVAFVATIYGVATANVILLPTAGKLKIVLKRQAAIKQMIIEGVISILEGLNPRMIEMKLESFTRQQDSFLPPIEKRKAA